MEVLGAVLGVSTLVVRTSSTIYSLIDIWREAPEGLHRLLDDLRRSQQFFDETEAGLREMYLGLPKEALESASFVSVSETLMALFEDAAAVIARIEKVIDKIVNGGGLESRNWGPEDLGKRRKLAWLRQSTTVTGLRKSLKGVTVGIYRLLVVQSIRMSLGISATIERSAAELKSHMSNALANEVLPQVVSQFEELRTKMLSEVRDPILRQMTEFEDELASLQQSDDRATENHTVRNKYAQAPINCYRQRRRPCSLNCSCRCHMIAVNSFGNNSWKLSFFGLVVRVSGGSIDGECTYRACANIHLPRAKEVMLFYNCPSWLFRGGISAFFSSNMHGTPELNIRIFNRLETGTPESMTNIFGCIERGDVQAVKDLLQEGRASIYDIRGNTNETPLFAALYRIDIPIIRLLLQAGADPFSEVHMNPGLLWEVIQIHVSARRGGQELVDMIPVFDHVELSPLHRAVSGLLHLNLDDALCKTQYLAYLNHVDPESTWSPLDLAAFRGDTNAVSKLLKAGASATLQNKLGAPPLFHACCFSHYEVAKLLVEAGADVNEMVDDRGITPPFISAVNETGYETDRKVLSVVGNHVNHKLRKGATPLCFAAAQRSTKTVALLIDHGADVNHMDKDGDRPIMYAVVYRRHDNVRLLLKHGCDYRFTTAKGKNVLHYLAEFPDVEMFKVFKEARMRGFPTEQDRTQKIHVKTPLESFNQRDSTAELRRAFNELLESINKDDEEEEESEGSDEFCDAVEEL